MCICYEMRDPGRQTLEPSKPSNAVTSNFTKCRRMWKCRPNHTGTDVLHDVTRPALLFQTTAAAAGRSTQALVTPLLLGMPVNMGNPPPQTAGHPHQPDGICRWIRGGGRRTIETKTCLPRGLTDVSVQDEPARLQKTSEGVSLVQLWGRVWERERMRWIYQPTDGGSHSRELGGGLGRKPSDRTAAV